MRKPVLFVLILFAMSTQVLSQGIRGEIRDREGEPVPFAAIFIKELKRGTTCNGLGLFSLPLPEGTYSIIFRSLGYTEVSKTVEVGAEYTELMITLPPQTYMIPEVRVSASGEDPAYWIMRKTIGLANYHLHEISNYNAEIYIKGSAIIDKIPKVLAKRIEVNDFKVEEDQAYMLESLNEVKFTAPDQYDMRVIASQNTLPGFSENVNPMDYVNASLYQEQIETVVSPLARNAFSHYKFSFEGTFMEGTYVVSKIKVTPKRKSQQLVEGYLYIVEDIWCLHSSDLSVKTIAGILYLQQLYSLTSIQNDENGLGNYYEILGEMRSYYGQYISAIQLYDHAISQYQAVAHLPNPLPGSLSLLPVPRFRSFRVSCAWGILQGVYWGNLVLGW